ncbi:MAG: FKBP-type peptidyl-prolyl cis-trans isomerase [Rikenellaceae bacterium]
MAKKAKKEYSQENRQFLNTVRRQEDIINLESGVSYRIISSSSDPGGRTPTPGDVVSVHYEGRLISGHIFDTTLSGGYPEAFRLRDVIEGWQIALQLMRVGDKWEIFIPAPLGYGIRTNGDIPGGSTLIFTVELLSIT